MYNFNTFEKKIIKKLTKYIDCNFPNKRKSKYSNLYYVHNIFYILKTGCQWYNLKTKCHFTTIYKKFKYWSINEVFINFYNDNLNLYIKNRNSNQNYIKDLFIDSSHTKNICGIDNIGKNYYDRYRNSTKCHLIVDENKIPLAYTFTGGNIHDSTQTEVLVNKLSILNTDKRRSYNLIADKGYINNNTYNKLKDNKIYLIYPKRKNSLKHPKYSNSKKNKLNLRYIVEHIFSSLDKFRRLLNRYERHCKYFESFTLIAFSYFIERYL